MSRLSAPSFGWIILFASTASVAQAVTRTWDGNGANPPHGTFNVGNNWDTNVVPTNLDAAQFNLGLGYTVTFTNSPINNNLQFTGGNVVFTSSGGARTYSLTDASGGQVVTTLNAFLGSAAGSEGRVTVTGAGSQWTLSNVLTVGNSGTGDLTVSEGGEAQA